jgi:hypothetical protein
MEYKVILEDPGSKPVHVIKIIVDATGAGLRDTKEAVTAKLVPCLIMSGQSADAAEKLRSDLEQAGATARVHAQNEEVLTAHTLKKDHDGTPPKTRSANIRQKVYIIGAIVLISVAIIF